MAVLGSGKYGINRYGIESLPPVLVIPEDVRPSGAIEIEASLFRVAKDGTVLGDLSRNVVSGFVDWNVDRVDTSYLTAGFVLNAPDLVEPLTEYLSPVLKLRFQDERDPVEMQMGMFSMDLPGMSVNPRKHQETLNCRDMTWLMKNSVPQDTISFANGTPLMTAIQTLITDSGVVLYSLPSTSEVISGPLSIYPIFNRLEIANNLLEGAGFYHLFTDLGGYVTTREIIDLEDQSPSITISDLDPVGDLEVVRTNTTLANIVIVYKENLKGAPLIGRAVNDDPNSPTSTANVGPIVRREAVSTLTSQARADKLARALLRDARSFYQVVALDLLPGSWVGPFQTVDSTIITSSGKDLRGRYHLRTWRVGFTPSDALIHCEINRLVRYSDDNI